MPDGKNIGKVYSRKRFIIGRFKFNPNFSSGFRTGVSCGLRKNLDLDLNSSDGLNSVSGLKSDAGKKSSAGRKLGAELKPGTGRKSKKKIIKIVILMVVIIALFRLFCSYLEPIFQTICDDKVKSLATIITNQQSTIIMKKYQYDQLYTIEKDESGDIVVVRANVVPINNLISDLTENIQREFDNLNNVKVELPLGSLTGVYFISGFGPQIPINVSIAGTLDTNIKSEFIAQGINQTLHRVYVDFDCDMKIITPVKNFSQNVKNQVIIAEHVIVGNIPNSYYNFEGLENALDTLNIIE